MKILAFSIALGMASPAFAQAADTSQCAKVSPVTKSLDVAGLQADADCFGRAAVLDDDQADALRKAQSAARASQKYRLDRIAAIKALPPVTPPVVTPPAATWTKCADEDGACYVEGTANVRYGAGSAWTAKSVTGSTPCDNATFGDPIKGTVKTCETDGKVAAPPAAPPSAAAGFVSSPTLAGAPDIPSEFDEKLGVVAMGIPPVMTGDTVGAYRFTCGPGQVLGDDPIVYPGQPGKSHLHQFYGDTGANAYTTYESLRHSKADSTCNHHPDGAGGFKVLNPSAYWMPAMLDGKGNVRRPEYVSIYYKRVPASHAECSDNRITAGCLAVPNGIRFIFGRDMLNLAGPRTGDFHFACAAANGGSVPGGDGPNGVGFPDMTGALAVCKPGMKLLASIEAPSCWDGKNLDTPNHRDHVSFVYNTGQGYFACPAKTPYMIPRFILTAAYNILPGDEPTLWRLSSDAMAPNEPAGSTFHADFWEAHDPIEKATWTKFCIDGFLSSTMGNLCDGTGLPGAAWGNNPWDPQTVPIASLPKTPVRP